MDRNSKNQGFTQIPNHILKNVNWVESKFDEKSALIDLYYLAKFKDDYVIKKAQMIPLKPGQIGWSQKSLGERWEWSIGKVRRFLKNMQTAGEIDIEATNVSTTITLLHWVQNGRANEQAYEQANGNQIDRQTETKRYPNNIVNKGNRVNMEKKKPLIKHCPECHSTKKADRAKSWDCICDECGVQMVEKYELV